jgi:uncharacterized protein (TIGR02466 family)
MEFSVHQENWFSTPIWESEIKNINNQEIKDYCIYLKDNTKGVNISNRGGWHSSEILLPMPQDLRSLFSNLEVFVNENCFKEMGVPNLKFGNFWVNVNTPNSYNLAHDHQNSILSGVYYVSVPHDNMGDLVLHRGDTAEYFLKSDVERIGTKTNSFVAVKKPLESFFYIFPSWVKHHVESNISQGDRVSIAFNFIPENK